MNRDKYYHIDNEDSARRMIIEFERNGYPWTARLFRGCLAGEFAFDPLTPEQSSGRFKRFSRFTADRPAIRLIGDDGGENWGPSGWPLARRSIEWARAIMLHAAGAELHHYEALILSAKLTGRALMIETSTASLPEWIAFVKKFPTKRVLLIQPRDGDVHPAPVDRGAMH